MPRSKKPTFNVKLALTTFVLVPVRADDAEEAAEKAYEIYMKDEGGFEEVGDMDVATKSVTLAAS